MNPLAALAAAPPERLAALGVTKAEPASVMPQHPAEPVAWDNRPSWDNWSRR